MDALTYRVVQSEAFLKWLKSLRDRRTLARIAVRIDRIEEGNFGDLKSLGGAVHELRIGVGKGYRVYFTIHRPNLVLLLCGGDKSSQQRDIERARKMASNA